MLFPSLPSFYSSCWLATVCLFVFFYLNQLNSSGLMHKWKYYVHPSIPSLCNMYYLSVLSFPLSLLYITESIKSEWYRTYNCLHSIILNFVKDESSTTDEKKSICSCLVQWLGILFWFEVWMCTLTVFKLSYRAIEISFIVLLKNLLVNAITNLTPVARCYKYVIWLEYPFFHEMDFVLPSSGWWVDK